MAIPRSITGRLVLVLTLGTTILWLIAAMISSSVLQHELNESFDRALTETAHRLLPLAIDGIQDRDEPPDGQEIQHLAIEHDHDLVYQLRHAGGGILLRSDDAPERPFDTGLGSGFTDADGFRVYTLADPDSQMAIQVAESLAHRRDALLGSTLTLFLPLLLLIPLSVVGIWFAIRRGLKPLILLQAQIAARGSANLAPLSVEGLPAELTPIAGALASLIDRLRAAFDAERTFAANSAHELRTPIAGALAQTQRLIATSSDQQARAEGRKIEVTLRRLADLAERLIQLARADAGMALSGDALAVLPVLKLVVADCASRSRSRRELSVKVEPGAETLMTKMNVDALAIVFRNLIDNAIAHSPADTPVEVEVSADGRISVKNAGPVIPSETLARLGRRFERGPTTASGSGLGLTIVETILQQVGASLELRSPASRREDGFQATINLP
jgi:two-component system OmpR family sensor kinase